eukprot:CAMPEP_0113667938 /NCGR_PEP_ID=MMETSP0038_2-20120614/3722_1 /TAXON_ID=2898 /ORGANISM="Cryptomonas paramecium" /LENGTH=80 /DNA_ID=CAMNT_0000583625 /DNA_START=25 /DNA_END=267 /DNA_ORIENTATION=- /assembly_acc=CAM_ASM_000170
MSTPAGVEALRNLARGGAFVFGIGYASLRVRYLERKEKRIANKEAKAAKRADHGKKHEGPKHEEGGFFDELFKDEAPAKH